MSEKTTSNIVTNILLLTIVSILSVILYQFIEMQNLNQQNQTLEQIFVDKRKYNVDIKTHSIDFTKLDKKFFVEKICINNYVYINLYQKMPVMSVSIGSSVAYPNYLVLKSTTQSFVDSKEFLASPEKCLNF